jgi:hypothetical protein
MTIHGEKITQRLLQRIIHPTRGTKIRLHQQSQNFLLGNDVCEHQLGEGFCGRSGDFGLVGIAEGFLPECGDGLGFDGFGGEDGEGVGHEDVGEDVEDFDADGFVAAGEAVEEEA